MQPGGQFAGFRHATAPEVASLYASAGFGEGFIAESSGSFQNVVSLISLLGMPAGSGAVGITGSLDGNEAALVAYMSYGSVGDTRGYSVTANMPTTKYGLDTQFPSAGNWLVVVPEPSSGALLLIAWLITVGSRHLTFTRNRRPEGT